MDCSFSCSFSVKPITDAHLRNVSYLLVASIAASVIMFGGLGAVQNGCSNDEDPVMLRGVGGWSGNFTCKKLYRYWWFVTSMGFVAAFYGLCVTMMGKLQSTKMAVSGLLIISSLLTIFMTNAFLNAKDTSKFMGGVAKQSVNAVVAGCIIMTVFQCFSIFLIGMESSPSEEVAKPAKEAAPAPKVVEAAPAPAPKAVEAPAAAPAAPVEAPVPAPAPAEVPVPAPATESPAVAVSMGDSA